MKAFQETAASGVWSRGEMRFLYADSEPFPLDYDFLATLRSFVRAAARSYAHLADIERLQAEIEGRNAATHDVLAALASFGSALEAAREAAERHYTNVPAVIVYSQELASHLERTQKAARELHARGNEDHNANALAEIEKHRKEVRTLVEEFVLQAQLGMELAYGRIGLAGETYEMRVGTWTQGPIEVEYGVKPGRMAEWKEPRRIDELTGGLILQVGMKKKFLSKALTRQFVDVSDYTLTGAIVHARGGEIQLRRKVSSDKDQILLHILHENGNFVANVFRPGDGSAPFTAVGESLVNVEKLWRVLMEASKETLEHRDSVHGVRLDGQDLFAQDAAPQLFDRLIDLYAPTVKEIARRSPSPLELSLKLQRDDGRREEVYLRKSELAEELAPLDAPMRARFTPLGLA